jgi:hypothetical protein
MNARQRIDSTLSRPGRKLEFPLKDGLKIGSSFLAVRLAADAKL